MNLQKSKFLFLVFILLFLTACSVEKPGGDSTFAETFPGQFLVGDVYILEKHEKIDGDVAGIGTTLIIEDGATVMGDITLIGSTFEISGRVAGDVTVIAGSSLIDGTALITGSLNQAFHQLNLHPGAHVYGEINSYEFPERDGNANFPGLTGLIEWLQPSTLLIYQVIRLLIFSLFTLMSVTLFKTNTSRAVLSLEKHLPASWGAGLIGMLAVPIVSTVLLITICLSPIALLLTIVFLVSLMWGWTILAAAFGRLFTSWLRIEWDEIPTAIFGSVVLGLVTGLISIIPCIGFLFNVTLAAAGLGSVLLSRFGRVTE